MAKAKKVMKTIGRHAWERFKESFPITLMYCCAGSILLMLTMKGEEMKWDTAKLLWTIVCIVAAAAYNALIAYAIGGKSYEMLVSGNMKRYTAVEYGSEYKISAHKEANEYRAWKGFAVGGMISIFTILVAIIFGCNQAAIDAKKVETGFVGLMMFCFFLSGWSILPIYFLNMSGYAISYFVSCLFALVPILVSGIMYIVGAYAKRNKAWREREIAEKLAQEEEKKEKKINYGGLPGTKPRKRK